MSKFKNKSTQRGFTLIELLVVIAIIALLSSVVLASLSGARSKARDTKRIAESRSIETALTLYTLKHNGYLPESAWHSMSDSGLKNGDGSINCTGPNKANNDQLFSLLITEKLLASAPTDDGLASQGYCYVYVTPIGQSGLGYAGKDIKMVAGATFDENGDSEIGKPILLALDSTKFTRTGIFGFPRETRTVISGAYASFEGISIGTDPTILNMLNYNYTTGVSYDVTGGGGGY